LTMTSTICWNGSSTQGYNHHRPKSRIMFAIDCPSEHIFRMVMGNGLLVN
jgi:hypothetical protein